jgi:hypothetical protein
VNKLTFSKATRLLAHPLSLAAISLMLANDFIFKTLWPSWWTGKLSDLAGLFFLPFLLAALLSPFVPARRVGWLAFGLVGVGFTLLKIDPAFNSLVAGLGRSLTGLPVRARIDPSDLLALVSLLPAAWLWRRPVPSAGPGWNGRLLVLLLAAVVTLADAAAPDYGISCLTADGSKIMATAGMIGGSYQSTDGGLTWQPLSTQTQTDCHPVLQALEPVKDPATGATYRFRSGIAVERSDNGGLNWTSDYSFVPAAEVERTYVQMTRPGNLSFGSVPSAALVDPASGNLVLAMGQDGVLVRSRSGQWIWAAVGIYQHDALRQSGLAGILVLVQVQIWLALLAAFGWLYTRAARRISGKTTVWVILGWIYLALLSLTFTPEIITSSYLAIGVYLGLLFIAVVTLIALLIAGFRLKMEFFRLFAAVFSQMLILALALLLPYVLWAAGLLPQYLYALLASTALVVILFFVFSLGSRTRGKKI